jgi:hypothetical protein
MQKLKQQFLLNLHSDNGQLDQFRLVRNRGNQRTKNALVSDRS